MTKISKETVVEQFGEKISALSRRMIWQEHLAEEAAQEVWYEVIQSLDSFEKRSTISTWIYIIAKRTILRYVKRERVLEHADFDEHFNLPSIAFLGEDQERLSWVKEKCDHCLTAFCYCLKNDARLIFLFREFVELTDSEIAEIMDTSELNVRKISSRSKDRVKKFMVNDCILFNSEGNCRCRVTTEVKKIELDKEFSRYSHVVDVADFYKTFDKILPRKNYWEKKLR